MDVVDADVEEWARAQGWSAVCGEEVEEGVG